MTKQKAFIKKEVISFKDLYKFNYKINFILAILDKT